MKATEQTDPGRAGSPPNWVIFRLTQQFINQFSPEIRKNRSRPDAQTIGARGLLFGTAGESLVKVDTFRPLEQTSTETGSDELFRSAVQLVERSRKDPEITALELVGWYSFRQNRTAGPSPEDVDLHNKLFPHSKGVSVFIHPEHQSTVLADVYARPSDGILAPDHHITGWLRFDTEAPALRAIDATLLPRINDGHYLHVFEVLDSFERSAKKARWKRLTAPFRKAETTPQAGGAALQNQRGSGLVARPSNSLLQPGPGAPAPTGRSRLLLVSTAVISAVAVGTAAAWIIVHKNPVAASPDNTPLAEVTAAPDLGMRVEAHDQRLVVSWDRSAPLVRSATEGVLAIDDGARHREVHLDAAQVATGSVFYKPASDDVLFRLEIHGNEGSSLIQTVRALDGSNPEPQAGAAREVEETRRASSTGNPLKLEKSDSALPRRVDSFVPQAPTVKEVASANLRSGVSVPTPAPAPTVATKVFHIDMPSQPVKKPAATVSALSAPTDGPVLSLTADSAPLPMVEQPRNIPGAPPSASAPPKADAPVSKPALANTNGSAPLSGLAVPAPVRQIPTQSPQPRPSASTVSGYVGPRVVRQVLPSAPSGQTNPSSFTSVDVQVVIDKQGQVKDARVLNASGQTNPLNVQRAIAAAKQWAFEPAKQDGQGVQSEKTLTFKFATAK